ncbi:MAG: hypothetical protein ACYCT0_09275, partial [Sulfobacillus sp.]
RIQVGREPQVILGAAKIRVAQVHGQIRQKVGEVLARAHPVSEAMNTIGVAQEIQTFGFFSLSQPK